MSVDDAVVEVDYFTDPLCSWSWAMEPQIVRLRAALAGVARWRVRLVGMIDGPGFQDPLQDVHRPQQWAPQWTQVQQQTGMPCEPRIWHEDPPLDSRPAALAAAAAFGQGDRQGWALLRRLREAVMLERRNIARREVLEQIADEVASAGHLDAAAWRADLTSPQTRSRLRDDIHEASYHKIRRYPALLLRPSGAPQAMLLVGWRPWQVLERALDELSLPRIVEPEALLACADGLTEEERLELQIASDALAAWHHLPAGPTSLWRPPVR